MVRDHKASQESVDDDQLALISAALRGKPALGALEAGEGAQGFDTLAPQGDLVSMRQVRSHQRCVDAGDVRTQSIAQGRAGAAGYVIVARHRQHAFKLCGLGV